MTGSVRGPFEPAPPPYSRRLIPYLTVMAGSLVTILPVLATIPLLPPFGLLMLIGWRLLRPEALRVWAPVPLGLFDDLFSGQPMGSAILVWSLVFLTIELIDARLSTDRDFWQNGLLAAGAITFALIAGRLIAVPLGASVDGVLGVQIMVSILAFPLVSRVTAWIDRRREPA